MGGIGSAILALSKSLHLAKVEVSIINTIINNDNMFDKNELNEIPIFNIHWDKKQNRLTKEQASLIDRTGGDFFYFHGTFLKSNRIIAKFVHDTLKKPYLLSGHGCFTTFTPLKFFKKLLYFNTIDKSFLGDAEFIIAQTEKEKHEILKLLPLISGNKIKVLPLPIFPLPKPKEQIQFRKMLKIPDDSFIFLFMGRLDIFNKGLDLLIPSFIKFATECNNIYLVIAGKDEKNGLNIVQSMFSKMKYNGDRVLILNPQYGDNKYHLLSQANVFVTLSRYESFGITPLEAMTLKKPVLLSNKLYLSNEIYNNNAALTVPLHEKNIIDAFHLLYKNEDLRERLSNQGFSWVTSYCNPYNVGKKFESFIV